MSKINTKAIYFGLIPLLGLNLNLAAVRVSYTFRIDELANKVSADLTERKPWHSRLFGSKPEPTVNGIGLVLAFEKLGIDKSVSPCAAKCYTIRELLQEVDKNICIALVKYS